jgi:hypothetical protein
MAAVCPGPAGYGDRAGGVSNGLTRGWERVQNQEPRVAVLTPKGARQQIRHEAARLGSEA